MLKDWKDMEGAHFGCNYLSKPGTICNKCGMYVKPLEISYDWEEHSETIEYKCTLSDVPDKWNIQAVIEVNNQGGMNSAFVKVFLELDKFKSVYGSRLVSGENIFYFRLGRGTTEDLKKICQDFFETNFMGKEITTEFLARFSK